MSTVLILIGVILTIAIFIFIKAKYFKHKLFWILILCTAVFVYISFTISIAGQGVNLDSIEGLQKAWTIYYAWMGNSFSNVKSISGNAVKMDWKVNATSILSK